jgi:hypothetical protein
VGAVSGAETKKGVAVGPFLPADLKISSLGLH